MKKHRRAPFRRTDISGRDYIVFGTRVYLALTLLCAVSAALFLHFAVKSALNSLNEALCVRGMYRTPALVSSLALTSPDIACDGCEESADGTSLELLPIARLDMSRIKTPGELLLSNETPYEPDLYALADSYTQLAARSYPTLAVASATAAKKSESESGGDIAPLVLIIHTHGTEAFTDEGVEGFPANYSPPRSQDITKNVVAAGAVISDMLNLSGIPTLHCEIMHDAESYLHSYERSLETVEEYLTRYPSIRYVLDVHRDAIETSSGALIDPTTEVNGERTAQIMFVVGTDYKGAEHTRWRENLALACTLQRALNGSYSNIARPINLRGASFNQQYSAGALLVEIGSAASTLTEVKRAALIFAQTFAVEAGGTRYTAS
ncbi:MAG: stage II sporulation protein P [Eubacteriales bacterium]